MIKTFSPQTCAFDCEWTPCANTARRLLNLPPTCSEREAFDAVWRAYAKEEGERPFLKLCLSKVVTVAAVFRTAPDGRQARLELFSQSSEQAGEAALIAAFLERVASGKWQLWGYNSASADLPILKQRALALDAPVPAFSRRPAKPWEGADYHDARNSDAHMDILDVIGGFGNGAAKPKLHELAAACGFPGKLDTAGGDVADLYLDRRMDDILRYNETDAVTTHLLMLRVAHVSGKLTDAAYEAELDAVERLVKMQFALGKAQFVRFWGAWKGEQGALAGAPVPPPANATNGANGAPPAAPANGANGANGPQAANAAPAALRDPALEVKLFSAWKDVLAQVKAEVGQHQTAALHAVRDIRIHGGAVTLHFGNNEFSRRMCERDADRVAAVLAHFLDAPAVTLTCASGDGAPVEREISGAAVGR